MPITTEVRYHINPETGRAGQCTAKKQCRFGVPASQHYNSKDEARAAYESKMSAGNVTSVTTKRTVVSSQKTTPKSNANTGSTDTAVLVDNLKQQIEHFPMWRFNNSEQTLLKKLAEGRKVSNETLDDFLHNNRNLSVEDQYITSADAKENAQLLDNVTKIRKTYNSPSTLVTLDNFDPATHTIFSNPQARKMGSIAGKAISREFAHAEWMEELAQQHENEIKYSLTDDESRKIENGVLKCRDERAASEAKLMAQLKEVKYLMDNDESFRKTLTPTIISKVNQALINGEVSCAGRVVPRPKKVK